jgi:hypothetical protein
VKNFSGVARVSTVKMPRIIVSLITLAALMGCERDDAIAIYDAPKDPPPATAPAMMALADVNNPHGVDPHAGHGHSADALAWDAPQSWKQQPAGEMRFAVYQLHDDPPVQLTVIPLGRESGDLLANVNRWEQQVGLPPTPADKLDTVTKKLAPNGLDVTVVDLHGKEQRMLAAIVPHEGRVWFFKAVGPPEVMEKQKANFDAFMASLKPGTGEPGHADEPAKPAAVTQKLAEHKAPADWKELPGSTPPRIVAFQIGPEAQGADMIATRFAANNAGSFHDNINRWRGQIDLPPVDNTREVPMSDAEVGDEPGVIIEFDNSAGEEPRRMLVALASVGPDLWFFKLTGPPDVVEKQRKPFESFLKSLKFTPEGEAK